LKLAGLKLWIHGYQYQDADDHRDGNWLRATAICSANGASFLVSGPFIRNTELNGLQCAVAVLHANLEGKAALTCMEPELAVTLKAGPLGSVEMSVEITPDQSALWH